MGEGKVKEEMVEGKVEEAVTEGKVEEVVGKVNEKVEEGGRSWRFYQKREKGGGAPCRRMGVVLAQEGGEGREEGSKGR